MLLINKQLTTQCYDTLRVWDLESKTEKSCVPGLPYRISPITGKQGERQFAFQRTNWEARPDTGQAHPVCFTRHD